LKSIIAFIIDYCQRHAHPVNAVLHIFGVPAAFYGFYLLFRGQLLSAFFLIVVGYLLQYLGHQAQGNEVGEVTLIKHVWKNLKKITSTQGEHQ
jgi:hypothetical protein